MPLVITKREAVNIATHGAKVIYRAWHTDKFSKGMKVPVTLQGEEGAPSRAPFVLEVIGSIKMTVDDMDDAKAKQGGFHNLADWKTHWAKLYEGTNRVRGTTRVFAVRFRKSEMVHQRRRVIDSPV